MYDQNLYRSGRSTPNDRTFQALCGRLYKPVRRNRLLEFPNSKQSEDRDGSICLLRNLPVWHYNRPLCSDSMMKDRHTGEIFCEIQPMVSKLKTICLVTLLSIPPAAISQISSNVGTSGFQFLKIGVGAHETALAGAGTATVRGPEALFWNVAGITKDDQRSALFFYNSWFASIRQDFIAFSVPC